MPVERIAYLADQELMYHLNRAIQFHENGDQYNACRWVERCIGVVYMAASLGVVNDVEGWNVISMLIRSGLRKGEHNVESND